MKILSILVALGFMSGCSSISLRKQYTTTLYNDIYIKECTKCRNAGFACIADVTIQSDVIVRCADMQTVRAIYGDGAFVKLETQEAKTK